MPKNIIKLIPVTKRRPVVSGHDAPFSIATQVNLEMVLLMRRELRELEEEIAVALSKGAKVEDGVHTAELVPVRKNGKLYLKLVIR